MMVAIAAIFLALSSVIVGCAPAKVVVTDCVTVGEVDGHVIRECEPLR